MLMVMDGKSMEGEARWVLIQIYVMWVYKVSKHRVLTKRRVCDTGEYTDVVELRYALEVVNWQQYNQWV